MPPPPPIITLQASTSPLPAAPLPQGQEQEEGSTAPAAAFTQKRSMSDAPGRVDLPDGAVQRRGSIASTRRSILSFVSARSARSIEDGGKDGLDVFPANVDDDGDESTGTEANGSGPVAGSGTDSDLDEFFDAMAEADEREG